MRRSPGFTLIELLVVISIIGVLAAVLLPELMGTREAANVSADGFQLKKHFTWFELYKLQAKGYPAEGGYKFVLTPWTSNVVAHTPENFDHYFAPGARENDPVWRTKREDFAKGLPVTPDLKSASSEDTTYVGRAKGHLKSIEAAGEAIMADDNEGIWTLKNGSVNILLADGNVRTISYLIMTERYGLGPLDKDNPVKTYGSDSPIEECKKLDN